MSKYYAVRKGRVTGVLNSWEECRRSVYKFSGAQFKSFNTEAEALDYLAIPGSSVDVISDNEEPEAHDFSRGFSHNETGSGAFAFVDGSFNQATGVYGYGGFVEYDNTRYYIQGNGNDEEMAAMRNVAGEICGAMAAVKKARELGIKELTIYYDYEGIRSWADGLWKRNKGGTIAYHEFMREARADMDICFVHVKGHSGVEGNEEADRLAKEAVKLAKPASN